MDVHIHILRFNPEEDQRAHFDDYTVSAGPIDPLLDCLNTIKWTLTRPSRFAASAGWDVRLGRHGIPRRDAVMT